jgi:hypothetical protein
MEVENNKAAIEAWEKSISIRPSSDAYTSELECSLERVSPANIMKTDLASAYILTRPPQPAKAITYLT